MNNYFKNILLNSGYKRLFLSIIGLILLLIFISPVSSATINIDSNLNNQDIQLLIDNANHGDTFNFVGKRYDNISLVVNKKLNIISSVKTVITTSSSSNNNNNNNGNGNNNKSNNNSNGNNNNNNGLDLSESFGFYFGKNSYGSTFSGFTIISNSDYGIILENTSKIEIKYNSINGGLKASIKFKNVNDSIIHGNDIYNSKSSLFIENSKNIHINSNTIYNNLFNGILVNNSLNIKIEKNLIQKNNVNGIFISNSKGTSITNNSIESNGNGIYVSNINQTNILNNSISNNLGSGIHMMDRTENTLISRNEISKNVNGIYLSSLSINDLIIFNTIKESEKSAMTDVPASETGNGIVVGETYDSKSTVSIENNIILNNQNFGVKNNPQFSKFLIGANWFGTNNRFASHICPMVLSKILQAKFNRVSGGFEIGFYNENKKVSGLPSVSAKISVNGGEFQDIIIKDGNIVIPYKYDSSKLDYVTVKIGDEEIKIDVKSSSLDKNQNINPKPEDDKFDSNNDNTGESKNDEKTDGDSRDNNQTLKKSIVVENSTSSVGDNGKTSPSENTKGRGKAFETSINKIINSIKDPSIIPYIVFAILLVLIGVGYFRKRK
jgi:parallel beta-helix repeat protein